jgi:chorismate mutase
VIGDASHGDGVTDDGSHGDGVTADGSDGDGVTDDGSHDGGGTGVSELRDRIEATDREIIAAIAERVRLARRIGSLKQDAAGATLDPGREAAVIRRAVEAAREHGIAAEPIRDVFWTLIGLCRDAQLGER